MWNEEVEYATPMMLIRIGVNVATWDILMEEDAAIRQMVKVEARQSLDECGT